MTARIAAALLLVAPFLAAQDPSTDERRVRALDEQERVAALKGDVKALERLWSDQLIVNAPNNRVLIGKQAVLDVLIGSSVITFSSLERTVDVVRVDGDYVFLMGAETARHVESEQTVRRRFTHVWKNEAGTWRLYARHANNVTVILPR
jgi:ketosteroid isomerase-like protein